MKKINIIKSNDEYNRIIKTANPFKYKEYIIYLERNNDNIYRFGFSIGKKLCNAVGRNKIKRQLKSIIDKNTYQKNFNCIIMVRKSILDKSFQEMETVLNECFKKVNIIEKGDIHE